MIRHRKEFLEALFRILEQEVVPYCVLRNYGKIYDEMLSDVDLAVEPEHLPRMKKCLEQAAARTNHRLVLCTRYVNFSYVFWHPDGFFIRVDVETELRWRVFPILTAKSIVGLRRREGEFYIPHPRHESVILFAAAVWRGYLSERYRQQLARLDRQVEGPEELRRTYGAAFGRVGGELASWQARILDESPRPGLWRGARRSIMFNAFHDGPSRRALLGYLAQDMTRFFERLRRPPGMSLLRVSRDYANRNMEEVFERMEVIFPATKAVVQAVEPSTGFLAPGFRLPRLRTLFKGGLFLGSRGCLSDGGLQEITRNYSRHLYPARSFMSFESPQGGTCVGHVDSGYMAEFSSANGASVFHEAMIRFISGILEKQLVPGGATSCKRGAFVVLAGPDGSGKTTVARRICCLAETQKQFCRVRYFHWRPRILGETVFPLPQYQEVRRKPKLGGNLLQSCFSAGRLLKNLVLTKVAHWLRIGPLLRRNTLVLADRYFYNYYLDPVSVKYYGPRWLLDRLRPFFPRPDLVVVLKAPAEVLHERKRELSRDEIRHQNLLLDQLPLDGIQRLEVDASQPAEETARRIVQRIIEMLA